MKPEEEAIPAAQHELYESSHIYKRIVYERCRVNLQRITEYVYILYCMVKKYSIAV
jgi:hypothetical protein